MLESTAPSQTRQTRPMIILTHRCLMNSTTEGKTAISPKIPNPPRPHTPPRTEIKTDFSEARTLRGEG